LMAIIIISFRIHLNSRLNIRINFSFLKTIIWLLIYLNLIFPSIVIIT